jgi:hypothetical protein
MNSMNPLWQEFTAWAVSQGMHLDDVVQLPDDEYNRVVSVFHRSLPKTATKSKTCGFCHGSLDSNDPDYCSDQCSKAASAVA